MPNCQWLCSRFPAPSLKFGVSLPTDKVLRGGAVTKKKIKKLNKT